MVGPGPFQEVLCDDGPQPREHADMTPAEQAELIAFLRARLAEEKQKVLKEIAVKERLLDEAEEFAPRLANPKNDRPVGDGWGAFITSLMAAPYSQHPDYQEWWGR